MSSFHRKFVEPLISGTKLSPQSGLIIISSGNPALDEILGGGIPMNSIVLIEEDKHGVYSKVLTKYFIADGVVEEHGIFLASLDEKPEDIFRKLPKRVEPNYDDNESVDIGMDINSLKIAWRYNDLPYLNSEKSERVSRNVYNLTAHMTEDYLSNVEKKFWDGTEIKTEVTLEIESPKEEIITENNIDNESTNSMPTMNLFTNKHFQNLINDLLNISKSDGFCRICIPSLGSPLWYDDEFGQDLLKFLTILRAIVQNIDGACFLTMPMHLIAKYDETLVPKIRNLVDFAMELDSFAGSDREKNPAFKEYHGLFHFRKMSAINSIALFQHSDLAFKLRRKRFIIEKFHLPPELGDQNQEDDMSKPSSANCMSSSSSSKLDF